MPHRHNHHGRRHGGVEKRGNIRDQILDIIGDIAPNKRETVSVIYITADPTFDGPIGGYSTEGRPAKTQDHGEVGTPLEHTRTVSRTTVRPTPTRKPTPKSTPTTTENTTDTPSSRPKTTPSTLITSTPSSPDVVPTSTLDNDASGMSSATSTPSSTAAPASGGLSSGGKAGLAIGIIALLGLLAGAALLFVRKKKKKNEEMETINTEKPMPPLPSPQVVAPSPPPQQHQMTPSAPPQLNIRPITQFSPDLTSPSQSSSTMVNVAGVVAARNLTGQHNDSQSTFSPPKTADSTSNPFNDPVNPFEPRSGASSPTSALGSGPSQPLNGHPSSPETSSVRAPTPDGMSTGAAVAVGAATAITAGAAANSHSGKPPTLQHVPGPPAGWMKDMPPPSPAMSIDSVSVTSTTAAAVATGGPAPNNVHRVQLDFSPSMDDELELRAGQLVRLLHEYDDGWALCIRLDRSQQGVAPRTCLSARPVKPRPRNGPPGPGPRGPPPMGGSHGRPMTPASGRNSPAPGPPPSGPPPPGPPRFAPEQGSRPASPSSGYRPYHAPNQPMAPVRFPDVPRSLSPGPGSRTPQQRSMSPGPYGAGGMEKPNMPEAQRKRSNSAAGAVGRIHAPNPGPSALSASVQNANSGDKPTEKPADNPADKLTDKPAEIPADKPTEKPVDKPAENPEPQAAEQTPPESTPQPPAEQGVRRPPPSLGPVERKPVPGQAQ
ncbi:hypothetical protein DIZ76_017309 [Coccidioides immitis]|nr:hypothetical protein DIZ76_017309 [Coccidioides immitis]